MAKATTKTTTSSPVLTDKAVLAFSKKVAAVLKKRSHEAVLSDRDMLEIKNSMAASHDPERTAQELITGRAFYEDDPTPPDDAAPANPPANEAEAEEGVQASEETPEIELGTITKSLRGDPADYSATVGVVTVHFPMPIRKDKARIWAAYHARALGVIIQLKDVVTGAVLESFDRTSGAVEGASIEAPAMRETNTPKRRTLKSAEASSETKPAVQRAAKGKYTAVTEQGAKLAMAKEGVSRKKLREIAGEDLNWSGMLQNFGKKQKPGLALSSEKKDGVTFYHLR